jgi:hypothetical protein
MSENMPYKTIKDLVKEVDAFVNLLNEGKLELKDIENLHGASRELYERITLVRYKAIEKESNPKFAVIPPAVEEVLPPRQVENTETEKKAEADKPTEETKPAISFKLNMQPSEEAAEKQPEAVEEVKVEEVSKNQISLLDEIEARSSEKSLNEKFALSGQQGTLADKLKKQPIKDLKESIGLNQKFLFMNELFQGENIAYNEALDRLNSFPGFNEARTYMVTELSEKYRWDGDSEFVQSFMELVERRYLG